MANEALAKYGMIFILVIVGFSLFAALYPEAADAGTGLGDEGMCENNACFYNSSRTTDCTNSNETAQDTTACTASGYVTGGFPLGNLFVGGGVLFVVIAAAILMFYIKKRQ